MQDVLYIAVWLEIFPSAVFSANLGLLIFCLMYAIAFYVDPRSCLWTAGVYQSTVRAGYLPEGADDITLFGGVAKDDA